MMDHNMAATDTLNSTHEEELVEVMYARTVGEAKACIRELLASDIPARMESGMGLGDGVAVLVPADRLILASEILAAKADDDEDEEEDEETAEDDTDDADEEFDDEDEEFDDDEDEDDLDDDDDDEEEEFEDDDDF